MPKQRAFLVTNSESSWTTPLHSRKAYDRAGEDLRKYDEYIKQGLLSDDLDEALSLLRRARLAEDTVNNWRSSHSFPLNTFQNGLRKRGRRIDPECLVAQRIKRLKSIQRKLYEFPTMKLTQIQDMGGARAVLSSVANVYKMVDAHKNSEIKHELFAEDDYIKRPRQSGYRSVHLVYRYYSDRNDTFNKLKIELQLRSSLQHAWATAVETVGTFIKEPLKSGQGDENWLYFFRLASSAIAMSEECNIVYGTPTGFDTLCRELHDMDKVLDATNKLSAFRAAMSRAGTIGSKASYYLLALNLQDRKVRVQGYSQANLQKAQSDFVDAEQSFDDAVLVSVDSMKSLRTAYPNYFADTAKFTNFLQRFY